MLKLFQLTKVNINVVSVIQDTANKAIKVADATEVKRAYKEWKSLFFYSCKSNHTRRAYKRAIDRFELFCSEEHIEPTALKYADAVKFIQSAQLNQKLDGTRRAPDSIKRDISTVSAFYSELYKHSDSKIINPFIRIWKKPARRRVRIKDIPDQKELELILANTKGVVHAAIYAMAYR
ncbi:MAG: site-specific integrase [Treponemataceae bacterium]